MMSSISKIWTEPEYNMKVDMPIDSDDETPPVVKQHEEEKISQQRVGKKPKIAPKRRSKAPKENLKTKCDSSTRPAIQRSSVYFSPIGNAGRPGQKLDRWHSS